MKNIFAFFLLYFIGITGVNAQTSYIPLSGNTIITGNNFIISDQGGTINNPSTINGSLTLCPTVNGQKMQIHFTNFNLTGGNTITVYNGNSTSSSIIATINSTNFSNFSYITATNLLGCLTVSYSATNSSIHGFDAEVNSVIPYPTSDIKPTVTINASPPYYTSSTISCHLSVSNVSGTGPTVPNSMHLFLSTDTILSINDWDVKTIALNSYTQPGQTNNLGTNNITISSTISAGNYYLLAVADYDNQITETNENNNVAYAGAITINVANVDIELLSISTADNSSNYGDSLAIGEIELGTVKVINNGSLSISNVKTAIYLSTDSVLSSNDFLLDTIFLTSIGPNITSTNGYGSAKVPGYYSPGTYYLIAYTDYTDNVAESNEVNNISVKRVTLFQPYTDLAVNFINPPTTMRCNDAVSVIFKSSELGKHGSYSYSTAFNFYLSSDTIIDNTDLLIATSSAISPTIGSLSQNISITLPDFTASGNYYLITKTDADNAIAETNEYNNVAYTPVEVLAMSYDFTISNISSADTFYYDTLNNLTLVGSYTLSNLGLENALNAPVRIYLSQDSLLSSNDYAFYNTTNIHINGQGTYNGNINTQISYAQFQEGTYYIICNADEPNNYYELNETNNQSIRKITIIQNRYDFSINSITPTNQPLYAHVRGNSNSMQIIYQGNTNLSKTADFDLYLSTDTILSAGDSLLQNSSRYFKSLDADTLATIVKIGNVTTGNYYILAVANVNHTIYETDESNNIKYIPIQILPDSLDLYFSNISTTASGIAGVTKTFSGSLADSSKGNSIVYGTMVYMYISDDTILDASDYYLTNYYFGYINVGSNNFTTTSTIPYNISGSKYIIYKCDALNTWGETNELNNIIYRPITIAAPTVDLKPTSNSPNNNPNVFANSTVNILSLCSNLGNNPVSNINFAVYLSTDTIFDASDVLKYNYTINSSIPAGSYASVSGQINMGNVSPGIYYLLFIADPNNNIVESDENNNIQYQPITVILNNTTYDLMPTNIAVSSIPLTAGSTTNQILTCKNFGTGTASNFAINMYLSNDNILDGSDILITNNAIGTVISGSTSNTTVPITIPVNTIAANYYIISFIDATNIYNETDENNNLYITPIEVVNSTVDLFIDATPAAYHYISTVTASYPSITIANFGLSASTAFNAGLYLSTDSVYDLGDILLATSTVAAIPIMGNRTVPFSSSVIPATVNAGNYYLLAFADNYQFVDETNETNNYYIWPAVVDSPNLDVAIDTAFLTRNIIANGGVDTLFAVVKNYSNKSHNGYSVRAYLSSDTVWDASDIALNSGTSYYYSPTNITYNYTNNITLPLTMVSGNYYVLVIADSYNNLSETNETNNIYRLPITVIPGYVDLSMDSIVVDTNLLRTGRTVQVDFYLSNKGNQPVGGNCLTSLYLSTDSILSPTTDYQLFSQTSLTSIPAGSSRKYTLTNSLSLSAGSYYLLASTDVNANIFEVNETNNKIVMPVTVKPINIDLSVASFNLNAANYQYPLTGQSINMDYKIVNNTFSSKSVIAGGKIVLSNDQIPDAGDIFVSGINIISLSNNGINNTSGTIYFTVPANISAGLHYLIIDIDTADTNQDPNRANNRQIIPILINASNIDLYPNNLTSNNGYLENGVSYSFNLSNIGTSNAGNFHYLAYLSTDSNATSTLGTIISQGTTSLFAQSSNTISFTPNVTPGIYYLIIRADDGNAIGEANETNNKYVKRVSVESAVTHYLLPDSTQHNPYLINCDGHIIINNTGYIYPAAQHTLYTGVLPTDTNTFIFNSLTLSAGGNLRIYAGSSTSSPLIGSYTSSNIVTSVLVNTDTFTLEFTSLNFPVSFFDINVKCYPVVPDLILLNAASPVDTIVAGNSYYAQYTIKNIGNGNAPSTTVTYNLSTDSLPNSNEIYLTSTPVTSLAAGAGITNNLNYNAPGGLLEGLYYLIISTDESNTIVELEEGNNYKALPVYYKRPTGVGLNEVIDEINFTEYVDRASNNIIVTCNATAPYNATLYNIMGQVITTSQSTNSKCMLHAPVSGVYLVSINQQGKNYITKVIVP